MTGSELYLYKAIGPFIGGAMGIVAESPEHAKEIYEAHCENEHQLDPMPIGDECLESSSQPFWEPLLSFALDTPKECRVVFFVEYQDG